MTIPGPVLGRFRSYCDHKRNKNRSQTARAFGPGRGVRERRGGLAVPVLDSGVRAVFFDAVGTLLFPEPAAPAATR